MRSGIATLLTPSLLFSFLLTVVQGLMLSVDRGSFAAAGLAIALGCVVLAVSTIV